MKSLAVMLAAMIPFMTMNAMEPVPDKAPRAEQRKPDDGRKQDKRTWRECMKAEKIAFLTSEMALTPAEAEKFWPLYNQADEEHFNSMEKVRDAYKALSDAVEKSSPESVISDCLKAYTKAMDESNSIDDKYIGKYMKVLSTEKVARLFLAEEKFRRQQISRFHKAGGPKRD